MSLNEAVEGAEHVLTGLQAAYLSADSLSTPLNTSFREALRIYAETYSFIFSVSISRPLYIVVYSNGPFIARHSWKHLYHSAWAWSWSCAYSCFVPPRWLPVQVYLRERIPRLLALVERKDETLWLSSCGMDIARLEAYRPGDLECISR